MSGLSPFANAAKSGGEMLAQSARPLVVARLVAANSPAMICAFLPIAAVALATGATEIAAALIPAMVASVALTAWAFFGETPKPRRGEALVSVAASFLLTILLVAPAFSVLGMDLADALFEATSSITTTGLSMAPTVADWPVAAHFMRAWLQWIGGFAFVAAALALVIGQGVIAKRLSAAGGISDDRAASTRSRARQLLAIYIGLSVIAVLAVAAAHPDPVRGALIALSAISTGGFSPYDDSVASGGLAAQAATIAGCAVGAVSLGLWWMVFREGPLKLIRDGEFRLFALIMVLGAAAVVAIETSSGGATPWAAIFTTVSAQTTAGFSIGNVADFSDPSRIALICVMVVGGCLGATAGGVKAFRLAFVLAATKLVLLRSRVPDGSVTYLRVFGRRTDPGEGTDVVGLLAIYGLSAATLWFTLVASGASALPALFDAVSALSTVGLSVGAITPDLPDFAKAVATVAMLLGRLEFLALIVLLTPGTWKKG
ncbi:MAG: potassium transporter TrkG [Pseudomonadota bacterium]